MKRIVFAAAAALCAPHTRAQTSTEEQAAAALIKAEDTAAKGRYANARAAYKRIAKKWPETMAGKEAFRRSQPSAYLGTTDLVRSGPSANRVDVVVMGDGYTLTSMRAFESVARTVPELFARNTTLGEYYDYHNFLRANVVSKQSGVDGHGRSYDTALGGHRTGAIQGQVGCDPAAVRRVLAQLPAHDGLAIVYVKSGFAGTGGRGIATIGGRGDKTTIHEWGHAFAGLGDEYAQTTGHRRQVRSRINVSATKTNPPWQHWLDAHVAGIGVYQGANGQERGAWKPVASSCQMERGERFCRVCREAFVLRIYDFVDPIDGCEPAAHYVEAPAADRQMPEPLVATKTLEFRVRLLRPKSHALDVRWWVLPESQAPRPRTRRPKARRSRRGALATLEAKPAATARTRKRSHRFRLAPQKLEPGRWRVICRVRDTTQFKDERWPWVLKDARGVLESERSWVVVKRARP